MRYVIEAVQYDKNLDMVMKVGGNPIYKPSEEHQNNGFFLMEIYNNNIINGNENIICWQLYQYEKYGGPIKKIIPIYKGADYLGELEVNKRKRVHEYSIVLVGNNEDYIDDDLVSSIGSAFDEDDEKMCARKNQKYVGILYDSLCDRQLNFGTGYVILSLDQDGNLCVN